RLRRAHLPDHPPGRTATRTGVLPAHGRRRVRAGAAPCRARAGAVGGGGHRAPGEVRDHRRAAGGAPGEVAAGAERAARPAFTCGASPRGSRRAAELAPGPRRLARLRARGGGAGCYERRAMNVHSTILSAIGHTPLVRLNKLVGPNDATVYAKCEFMNPGGSIKDRMALHIIEKGEREGKLKPGGVIVENTSGNTGMGVALAAAVKGYRCIFTMPDKMSAEKINRLKALGAQVVVTPTNVPAESPQSYYETAKRIARETPGSFYLNQYHNTDNGEAHYALTAPELWEQLEGRLDAFITGLGTAGTMSGVGKFLKEKNPAIRNVGVDPVGSVYQGYFQTGKLPEPTSTRWRASGRTCSARRWTSRSSTTFARSTISSASTLPGAWPARRASSPVEALAARCTSRWRSLASSVRGRWWWRCSPTPETVTS